MGYAYRVNLGINVNMNLENFHRCLKYFCLEGQNISRVDKFLFIFRKNLSEKFFHRLIDLIRGKTTAKKTKMNQSHVFAFTNFGNYFIESQSLTQ